MGRQQGSDEHNEGMNSFWPLLYLFNEYHEKVGMINIVMY